ncbi:PIN domain-containing protein [Avibacterium avium]|uniref:PIN domain-containing protein n=1 Tax=Avibacterium avium TaxID=751 RepID=UPI003BF7C929
MQQMLISDANIFIDLECCQLISLMFELPYRFCTPDVLFERELKLQHGHLLTIGLIKLTLLPESMTYVSQLTNKYRKTSIHDLMALSLAKQEKCPLLTGDKALRDAANREAVLIKGTIWVLEQLVIYKKISKDEAMSALDIMLKAGRRLPFDEAKSLIKNIKL